jgi:hypothetical protein
MSGSDLQPAWDAAIATCLTGHDQCTFGGMVPASGYWLAAEDCDLNHGHTCAWCPAEASTGFAGWGEDGWSMWQVPACEEHGAAWAAEHPQWSRDAPKAEPQSWQELLDGLNPIARELAEDMMQRDMDALLYGTGPRPDRPEFTGIDGLMAGIAGAELPAIVMPYPKAAPPGPPRLRYDPATKTWEAAQ